MAVFIYPDNVIKSGYCYFRVNILTGLFHNSHLGQNCQISKSMCCVQRKKISMKVIVLLFSICWTCLCVQPVTSLLILLPGTRVTTEVGLCDHVWLHSPANFLLLFERWYVFDVIESIIRVRPNSVHNTHNPLNTFFLDTKVQLHSSQSCSAWNMCHTGFYTAAFVCTSMSAEVVRHDGALPSFLFDLHMDGIS